MLLSANQLALIIFIKSRGFISHVASLKVYCKCLVRDSLQDYCII